MASLVCFLFSRQTHAIDQDSVYTSGWYMLIFSDGAMLIFSDGAMLIFSENLRGGFPFWRGVDDNPWMALSRRRPRTRGGRVDRVDCVADPPTPLIASVCVAESLAHIASRRGSTRTALAALGLVVAALAWHRSQGCLCLVANRA